jgi:hypothetical protein
MLLPIPQRFACDRCGALDLNGGIGGWSVKAELWDKHGNGKGMLCIHCFELSIGRRLTAEDVDTGSMDNETNAYIKLITKAPVF